jgi:hypothetical protein
LLRRLPGWPPRLKLRPPLLVGRLSSPAPSPSGDHGAALRGDGRVRGGELRAERRDELGLRRILLPRQLRPEQDKAGPRSTSFGGADVSGAGPRRAGADEVWAGAVELWAGGHRRGRGGWRAPELFAGVPGRRRCAGGGWGDCVDFLFIFLDFLVDFTGGSQSTSAN